MLKSLSIVVPGIILLSLAACAENTTHRQVSIIATNNAASISSLPIEVPQLAQASLSGTEEERFADFVESLKVTAAQQGISEQTIEQSFQDIYLLKRVIQSDKNQLEKKITLDDYLNRVLSTKRIKQGQENYTKYHKQLKRQAEKYRVPPQYIVALWGMESSYGRLQGKENIISAMSSLAFEGRRQEFFTHQLMDALRIIEKGHIKPEQLKGSWAGAMGQCQFMPSSFIRYAADGDGDGIIDIWNNVNDVFASTANYLATEGWDPSLRWGSEITLPKDFNQSLAGLGADKAKTVSQWQTLGIPFTAQDQHELSTNAWVIMPDDLEGRAFLVFNNFNVLMHWNRSYYFALSVSMLADQITKT